jgi:hypothetical protein
MSPGEAKSEGSSASAAAPGVAQGQIAALAKSVAQAQAAAVTRQEFDELKALVKKMAHQVERLVAQTPVPEEHLAMMAAAFATFLGRPVRVRSARALGPATSSWSQEGRSSLHSQRHVRRP